MTVSIPSASCARAPAPASMATRAAIAHSLVAARTFILCRWFKGLSVCLFVRCGVRRRLQQGVLRSLPARPRSSPLRPRALQVSDLPAIGRYESSRESRTSDLCFPRRLTWDFYSSWERKTPTRSPFRQLQCISPVGGLLSNFNPASGRVNEGRVLRVPWASLGTAWNLFAISRHCPLLQTQTCDRPIRKFILATAS